MRALKVGAAVLAVAAGVHAGPASAGGRPYPYVPAYAAPTSYDWSGFYIGGQAGGAHSSTEWTYTGTFDSLDQGHSGFAGGAHAGLQKQWSVFVLGAEVAYTWTDLEETSRSVPVANTSLTSQVSNLLLVTGKAGIAWEDLLAYAKGGYATGDVDFRTSVTSSGVVTTASSDRESGWTAGIGVDYALRPNIILGVEYDYVHLNVSGRDQGALPGSQVRDAGVDVQTVMARLSFKFGPRSERMPAPIK